MKPKVLAAVRPNVGLEAIYQRKIEQLVNEMHRSLLYWLRAAYNVNKPEMATDASPAMALRQVMRKLASRWQTRFEKAAPELARYFALAAWRRSDAALASILKRAGFTVKFKLTKQVNDILQASMGEQVGLIKSIAAQHLTQVEGLVMRSVQVGRDLGTLTKEIEQRYKLTHRRAALIARDQNNKATAIINRARQQEVGITEAVWMHSHGGRKPRPTHVKAGKDKVVYNISKGWFDPAIQKYIWPGTEINCRCASKSIIPGLPKLAHDSLRFAQDKAPSTWMEHQHPRGPDGKFTTVNNGVTHPKEGTTTGQVWKLANTISNAKLAHATKAEVLAEALKLGLNKNTIATQFSLWSKFHGTKGQKPVMTPKASVPEPEPEKIPELHQVLDDQGWQLDADNADGSQTFVNPKHYSAIKLTVKGDSWKATLHDGSPLTTGNGVDSFKDSFAPDDDDEDNAPTDFADLVATKLENAGFTPVDSGYEDTLIWGKGNVKVVYVISDDKWSIYGNGSVKSGDGLENLHGTLNNLASSTNVFAAAAAPEPAASEVEQVKPSQLAPHGFVLQTSDSLYSEYEDQDGNTILWNKQSGTWHTYTKGGSVIAKGLGPQSLLAATVKLKADSDALVIAAKQAASVAKYFEDSGFKQSKNQQTGQLIWSKPDPENLTGKINNEFWLDSKTQQWTEYDENVDIVSSGTGFSSLYNALDNYNDKQLSAAAAAPFDPVAHYKSTLPYADEVALGKADAYLKTVGFKIVDPNSGFLKWQKGDELFSLSPETDEWLHYDQDGKQTTGSGAISLKNEINNHAEASLTASVAALNKPAPAVSPPAQAQPVQPGKEIPPEQFKPAVKALAVQKGYAFKVGNDTYSYYTQPNGSKLSTNQKTQAWTLALASGQKISGKGFDALYKQLSGQGAPQPTPAHAASPVATPTPKPAPSAKPAAPPMLTPELIGAKLAQIGYPKEGKYGDLDYWKAANGSKVSVNFNTIGAAKPTWQFKAPGGTITKGEGLQKLDEFLQKVAPANIAAEWKAGKLPAAPEPKPANQTKGYQHGEAAAGKYAPVQTPHGEFKFSTHGVPLPHALPSNEQSAISTYTGSSYHQMNSALRTNTLASLSAPLKSAVLRMQAAFAKVPGCAAPVEVGRKVGYLALTNMCKKAGLNGVDDLKVGHVIADEGFVSTSHNPNVWSGDVRFRITIPKGAKAIYAKPVSHFSSEDETILPNGTQFKVNKIEKQPHGSAGKFIYNIQVEVVL